MRESCSLRPEGVEGWGRSRQHIEALDEMSHAGDLGKKLEAIQNIEYRVVAPLLDERFRRGRSWLLLLSDHPTFHDPHPRPAAPCRTLIYDSRKVERAV